MKLPTFIPAMADDLRRLPKGLDLHAGLIEAATKAALARIPAAELSDDAKMGMFIAQGVPVHSEMVGGRFRMVTAVPVGIVDRGDGGYIIGVRKAS